MNKTANVDDCSKLLHELQSLDFVLVELTLYLDTHPTDMLSLQQFNQYSSKRKQVSAEYEERFGPLMQFGHSYSRYPWQWSQSPWPWQL
jgi:spore coat protein JB